MSKSSSTSSVTHKVSAETRMQPQPDRAVGQRRRFASDGTPRRRTPKNEASCGVKREAMQAGKDSASTTRGERDTAVTSGATSSSQKGADAARCARHEGPRSKETAQDLEDSSLNAELVGFESGVVGGLLTPETGARLPQAELREVGHDLSRPAASSLSGRTSTERAEVARAAIVSDPRGRFDLQELRSVRVQLEQGVTMQFSQNGQGATARVQSQHALGTQQREELRAAMGQHGYALDHAEQEDGAGRRGGGSNE